jgi:tight adherence protein B
MNALFYGFVIFLFAAIILGIEGVYLWWMGTHGKAAQRITRRLQIMSGGIGRSGERISILKQRRYSGNDAVDQVLHRWPLAHHIDQLLVQSGARYVVEHFLLACLGAFLLGLGISSQWTLPGVVRIVFALVLGCAPYAMARRARTRRLVRIEEQLPEAADFIARALRAGHSFTNVLQIVGTELSEPLAGEFRIAREEINYGVPMSEALHNMADRIPLTDLRYLIIAVLIQRESGGNLAEILGNISQIIRGRLKLAGQVRVLSAEGRMSAMILGALPFLVALGMMVLNPKYIGLLWTDPIGTKLVWVGTCMLVFGVLWLRKIIHIHV